MNIVVTGGTGMVGSRIVERCAQAGHRVTSLSRHMPTSETALCAHCAVDLLDDQERRSALASAQPEWIIHTAAYTDVNKAQQEPEAAFALNRDLTAKLSEDARTGGAKLMYISTDYVFDGQKGKYSETDAPHPLNVYGQSKLEGEQKVQEVLGDTACIIRIAYPYRKAFAPKSDIVRKFDTWLSQGKSLSLVTDQRASFTWIDDIASAVVALIQSDASGIWHIAGSRAYSPYEIGVLLCEKRGYDPAAIQKVTLAEFESAYPDRPKTPKDSSLDVTKAQKKGITLHHAQEIIQHNY